VRQKALAQVRGYATALEHALGLEPGSASAGLLLGDGTVVAA
jgi:hypothetical protein